jgi:hypothetical protein
MVEARYSSVFFAELGDYSVGTGHQVNGAQEHSCKL